MKSITNLYIPNKNDLPLSYSDIKRWYENLLIERDCAQYGKKELELLTDASLYYGKYFIERTRNFFLHHFGDNLVESFNYLFGQKKDNIRFLEIGCGCGNQVLLAAFLGAEVVGCDIRQDVCDLIHKRKQFYEKVSGKQLNINLVCGNVFNVDWSQYGKFDAINYLFSFNFKPKGKNIDLINDLLKSGGRVSVQECNVSNYYNRFTRRLDALTPEDVKKNFRKLNFKVASLKGGCALPPFFWKFCSRKILFPFEELLCKSFLTSLSYVCFAEKI